MMHRCCCHKFETIVAERQDCSDAEDCYWCCYCTGAVVVVAETIGAGASDDDLFGKPVVEK